METKNKGLKIFIGFLASALLTIALFLGVYNLLNGDKGKDEIASLNDAYNNSVNNGFDGSMADWLSSIDEKFSYETIVNNGYEGSMEQWYTDLTNMINNYLQEKPDPLTYGITNVQVIDGNLIFTFSDGSRIDVGTFGKPGESGAAGAPGPAGKDGEPGSSIETLSGVQIVNKGNNKFTLKFSWSGTKEDGSPIPDQETDEFELAIPDVTGKVDKNQGTEHAGKILKVGDDGMVTVGDAPSSGNSFSVIDNLTSSTDTTNALSAKQGYVLKGLVDDKLNKNLGTINSGKILKVGVTGEVEFAEASSVGANINIAKNLTTDNDDWVLSAKQGKILNENKLNISGYTDKKGKYLYIDNDGKVGFADATNVTVDSALSDSSTNPVQNKVITNALGDYIKVPAGIADGQILQYNSTSSKFEAADLPDDIDVDSALSDSSENPVQNKVINNALAGKVDLNQGTTNEGKILKVNASGNLALANLPDGVAYTADAGIKIDTGNIIKHSNSAITAETAGKGSTTAVPVIKFDAYGHITEVTTSTIYPPTTAGTANQYWKSDGDGVGMWETPLSALTGSPDLNKLVDGNALKTVDDKFADYVPWQAGNPKSGIADSTDKGKILKVGADGKLALADDEEGTTYKGDGDLTYADGTKTAEKGPITIEGTDNDVITHRTAPIPPGYPDSPYSTLGQYTAAVADYTFISTDTGPVKHNNDDVTKHAYKLPIQLHIDKYGHAVGVDTQKFYIPTQQALKPDPLDPTNSTVTDDGAYWRTVPLSLQGDDNKTVIDWASPIIDLTEPITDPTLLVTGQAVLDADFVTYKNGDLSKFGIIPNDTLGYALTVTGQTTSDGTTISNLAFTGKSLPNIEKSMLNTAPVDDGNDSNTDPVYKATLNTEEYTDIDRAALVKLIFSGDAEMTPIIFDGNLYKPVDHIPASGSEKSKNYYISADYDTNAFKLNILSISQVSVSSKDTLEFNVYSGLADYSSKPAADTNIHKYTLYGMLQNLPGYDSTAEQFINHSASDSDASSTSMQWNSNYTTPIIDATYKADGTTPMYIPMAFWADFSVNNNQQLLNPLGNVGATKVYYDDIPVEIRKSLYDNPRPFILRTGLSMQRYDFDGPPNPEVIDSYGDEKYITTIDLFFQPISNLYRGGENNPNSREYICFVRPSLYGGNVKLDWSQRPNSYHTPTIFSNDSILKLYIDAERKLDVETESTPYRVCLQNYTSFFTFSLLDSITESASYTDADPFNPIYEAKFLGPNNEYGLYNPYDLNSAKYKWYSVSDILDLIDDGRNPNTKQILICNEDGTYSWVDVNPDGSIDID